MNSLLNRSRSELRATAHSRRRARTPEAGFSLIEVIATALVTVLLGLAMATGLIAQAHASGDQQMRSEADALVNQNQDRLRGATDQALSNLASNGPTTSPPQVVGNESYTITSSAAYQTSAGSSSCASSSTAYFKISSQVSWTESFANNSTQTVSSTSLLIRPVTGQLETLVTDQTSAGLQGVSVTATPPTGSPFPGQSGTTDSTGCSLFAGLGVANYAITASKPGWVTPQNLTTAYATANVTNTGLVANASPAPVLGQAGSVTANFQAASPSAPGQADGVVYSGAGAGYPSVSGQGSTTTLPAATQTASSLFPFEPNAGSPVYTNNYSLSAGQCPAYQTPPAANVSSATVAPGATATATVKEPFLYVKAVVGNGFSVQPSDIVLTYSSGGCVDSYQANVAAPASGSGISATAPSNGWLASPGQPYAASSSVLSVCADFYVSAVTASQTGIPSGYYDGTATTANSSFTSMNPSVAGLTITVSAAGSCPVQ